MGFQIDRVVNGVENSLLCELCLDLLEDPVMSPCRHVYCRSCIHDWLKKDQTCPKDRNNLLVQNLIGAPFIITDLINKVDVKCSYENHGCQITTKFEFIKQHEINCEYNPEASIKCQNGCEALIKKKDQNIHSCIKTLKDELKQKTEQINDFKKLISQQNELINELSAKINAQNETQNKMIHDINNQNARILELENKIVKQNLTIDDDSKKTQAHDKSKQNNDIHECAICFDEIVNIKQLDKCGHAFCGCCIDMFFSNVGKYCPICDIVYEIVKGTQPLNARMTIRNTRTTLPGYPNSGTIVIEYDVPSGIQSPEHPHPGRPYHGTHRLAYLPDNKEGQELLTLLKKAFDNRLIFSIGYSKTTKMDDVVIWNGIHHKTNTNGGPARYGYPDPDYLTVLKQDLAAKGIY